MPDLTRYGPILDAALDRLDLPTDMTDDDLRHYARESTVGEDDTPREAMIRMVAVALRAIDVLDADAAEPVDELAALKAENERLRAQLAVDPRLRGIPVRHDPPELRRRAGGPWERLQPDGSWKPLEADPAPDQIQDGEGC